MSVHRYAAKRDENEPNIIEALRAHGCVVWQLSGKGLPDLLVLRKGTKWLADVKMPGKPTTEAQEELWEEAATKARCSVFILRTPEDAQKMLNNALQPWEPPPWCQNPGCIHRGPCPEHRPLSTAFPGGYVKRHRCGKNGCRKLRPCPEHNPLHRHQLDAMAQKLGATSRKDDAAKTGGMSVPRNGRDAKKACGCLRSLGRCEHSGNYVPPRSTPVDAAKEAEETFAPKAEPDWHELIAEAVALNKER